MIEFEFKKGLLVVRGIETVSLEEIYSSASRAGRHPLFEPGNNVLIDLRDVKSAELDATDLRALIKKEAAEKSSRKVAIVASQDHIYGLARMYQSIASELTSETKVFRDYFVGLAWLLRRNDPTQADFKLRRKRSTS